MLHGVYLFSRFVCSGKLASSVRYIHILRTSYMSYVLRILCAYLHEILQYLEAILAANKRANDQI